ncbi:MAG: hypothetical protein K2N56_05325 [Oscillospiraceae bacterium]|nr:hypothetical protein [Oscillospiraceae bacterium]
MAKLHKAATALLLAAVMSLGGCSERGNSPTQEPENISLDNTSGNSSKSFESSTSDISDSVSEQQSSTERESDSQSSSDGSSDISVDTVPVEFTEEDKELHKILKTLEGINVFEGWLTAEMDDPYDDVQLETFDLFIADTHMSHTYYKIPDNFAINGRVIPHTYAGLRDIMLENLTERFTDDLLKIMMLAGKGSIKEKNSDGTFLIELLDDGEYINKGYYRFLEIDGAMYCSTSVGGKGLGNVYVEPETAKVISKNDDTIEFTYMAGWYYSDDMDNTKKIDASYYAEHAITGVLKYERGGWRRDWDKDDWRLSWFTD